MTRYLSVAKTLCGVPEAEWNELSQLYSGMLVEADRIANALPAQNPEQALFCFERELEGRFPKISIKIISAMALLMHMAKRDSHSDNVVRFRKRII